MSKDIQALNELRARTQEDKQGVEIEIGGKKYVAFIRRLTPTECSRLQTIPEDYSFITSESQIYKQLGNGWNVETIKHIFQFIPDNLLHG